MKEKSEDLHKDDVIEDEPCVFDTSSGEIKTNSMVDPVGEVKDIVGEGDGVSFGVNEDQLLFTDSPFAGPEISKMMQEMNEIESRAEILNRSRKTPGKLSVALSGHHKNIELLHKSIEVFFQFNPSETLSAIDNVISENVAEAITKKYYPLFKTAGLPDREAQEEISDLIFIFLQACKNFVIRKTAEGYINSIVRNKINLYYRTKYKDSNRKVSLEEDEGSIEPGNAHYDLQSSGATLLFSDVMSLLTARQQEIVQLLIEGYSQQEISKKLDVKPSTVSYHIKKLRSLLILKLCLEPRGSIPGKTSNDSSKKENESQPPCTRITENGSG